MYVSNSPKFGSPNKVDDYLCRFRREPCPEQVQLGIVATEDIASGIIPAGLAGMLDEKHDNDVSHRTILLIEANLSQLIQLPNLIVERLSILLIHGTNELFRDIHTKCELIVPRYTRRSCSPVSAPRNLLWRSPSAGD